LIEQFKTKKTNQNYAQSEKSVKMEEWHRGVQRQLDPEWQRSAMTIPFSDSKESFTPTPEQKQSGWDCIEQSTLSYKHG